jgi:phosphoribosylformylglycinamidine synthase subunit PurL
LPAHLLADEVPIRYVVGEPDPGLDERQHPDWGAILRDEGRRTKDESKIPSSFVLRPSSQHSEALLAVLASPNVASKERVYRTYDHTIGSNTVLQPGQGDAAVMRIKGTQKGIALTIDCNGRYCYLAPYEGGAQAVAEAARNISCVGAEPLAVTDCLNFGNPEKPYVFYQMESAVNGMADACNALGIPVVSGNVSLYNETEGVAVLPTPVVGMLGLLENVEHRAGMAFRDGLRIGLLQGSGARGRGSGTRDQGSGDGVHGSGVELLGASQYVETMFGVKVGMPPRVDFDVERDVQSVCRVGIHTSLVDVAHDCSDGGLGVALAEMCIMGGVGARVALDALVERNPHVRSDVLLFAEEPSRIIVALPTPEWAALEELAQATGVGLFVLGETGGDRLRIDRGGEVLVEVEVGDLDEAWRNGLG